MFWTIKKNIGSLSFYIVSGFGESLVSYLKKCGSLKNQLSKSGPRIIKINSEKTVSYPFIVSINKSAGG